MRRLLLRSVTVLVTALMLGASVGVLLEAQPPTLTSATFRIITMPAVTAPTVTTNKLYNVGGTLTWNGAAITGASFPITAPNGGAIRTGTTAADTLLLQAYDTDTGPGYTTLLTLTAGTTPTMIGTFAGGSATAPGVVFNTHTGTGISSVSADDVRFGTSNTWRFRINSTGSFFRAEEFLKWTSDAVDSAVDLQLGREAAAILQLGSDAFTTAYTLKGNDRITSDGVGGDLTIAPGRGRGGAGGNFYLQTSPALGTGVDGVLATAFDIRNLNAAGLPTITNYGAAFFTEAFGRPHYVRAVTSTAIGGAKLLTDTSTNIVLGSAVGIIQFREEQTKTVSSWVDTDGTLDIDADAANDEGVEIDFADTVGVASGWITTRAAGSKGGGCFEVNITLGDNAGTDQLLIGWRKVEAFDGDNVYTNYNEWSIVGVNNVDGSIFSLGEVNGGGTLSDDSGVNWADGETRTLKSCIASTTGVPTAFYTAASGVTYTAITMTNSATAKTTTIQMIPFVSYMNAGADGNIRINWWRVTR